MQNTAAATDATHAPGRTAKVGRPKTRTDADVYANIALGPAHREIAHRAAGDSKRGALVKGIRVALEFWDKAQKN